MNPPIAPDDLEAMSREAEACFKLHRVRWLQSFLAADGARMLCWYEAPDAESARLALRQIGADLNGVWPGRIIGDDRTGEPLQRAGMVTEFRFEDPPDQSALIARITDAAVRHPGMGFVRGFMSTCGTRMACVFRSQDGTRLQTALASVGLSSETIWKCVHRSPQMLSA
jgi:hypothetical protein